MILERFQRPLTNAFHDQGGKLMTGSDTVLPGLVPGFALHRELRELVDIDSIASSSADQAA